MVDRLDEWTAGLGLRKCSVLGSDLKFEWTGPPGGYEIAFG